MDIFEPYSRLIYEVLTVAAAIVATSDGYLVLVKFKGTVGVVDSQCNLGIAELFLRSVPLNTTSSILSIAAI